MANLGPRYRTDFKSENALYQGYINGGFAGSILFKRWFHYHWMSDQINPIDKVLNRRPPGFCQHLKLDKTYIAAEFTYVNGTTTVREENPDYMAANATFGNWAGQSPTGSPTDPDDFGYMYVLGGDFLNTNRFKDLCFEAWTKLKTQVPADISVLNFAYEALDYKDIVKGIFNPKRAVQKLKDVAGSSKLGNVRKLPKVINSEFLDVSFNWLPLIGDIVKLTQVSDNAARRMNYLLKTKGKEVTVRFDKIDCYIHSLLGVPQHLGWQNSDWDRTFTLTKYNCDFHVTAKLYQDLEGLDDAYAGLRATIASLGINNPLKAFWNAVPFSFVMDWIAPFGTWLERAAVQPFYGVWKVYDITTSVRERGEIEMRVKPGTGGSVVFPDTLITRVSFDRYTRLVGLPQTLSGIDFTQLTSQQQKLFLSLVLTKVL